MKSLQGRQRNARKATKKGSDLICGQYTNACKLVQAYKLGTTNLFFSVSKFPIFNVIIICSKYSFLFQI
jgi:hypothetical protein